MRLVTTRTAELQLLKDILTLMHAAEDPADADDDNPAAPGDEDEDGDDDSNKESLSTTDQEETQVPTAFAAEDCLEAPSRSKVRPPVPAFAPAPPDAVEPHPADTYEAEGFKKQYTYSEDSQNPCLEATSPLRDPVKPPVAYVYVRDPVF